MYDNVHYPGKDREREKEREREKKNYKLHGKVVIQVTKLLKMEISVQDFEILLPTQI